MKMANRKRLLVQFYILLAEGPGIARGNFLTTYLILLSL